VIWGIDGGAVDGGGIDEGWVLLCSIGGDNTIVG